MPEAHIIAGHTTPAKTSLTRAVATLAAALLVSLGCAAASAAAATAATAASPVAASPVAATRLHGEVGERATLLRTLLTTGKVAAPGAIAEDPPYAITYQPGAAITVPAGGVAQLLSVFVRHGLIADAADADRLTAKLCSLDTSLPAAKRLGCWLDVVVWAQHTFVDGAALGARSQPLPPHLKRPTKKQRLAAARDHLLRRFRGIQQAVDMLTTDDVSARAERWLVDAGPGSWSAYTGLLAGLVRYRGLVVAQSSQAQLQPALPTDTPTPDKLAWRKRRLRRAWERKITDAHRQALRKRLCFENYCAAPPPPPRPNAPAAKKIRGFQSDVVEQLRAWQRHHGLRDHGMLDAATLRALAVPMVDRLATIRLTLQRMRDTGAGSEKRVFIANIPAFRLDVWLDGKRIRSHRTQVGKGVKRRGGRWVPGLRTPLISARLRYLVLNPEWVVPSSIRREYRWKIKRDPDYLKKHGFEMRGSPGRTTMVMTSGPGNLLGRVKFLFVNPYLVYLHDTPTQWAFNRPRRTMSHGCVRVQHAEELARFLLSTDRNRRYNTRSWDKLMKRVRNKWKPLRKVIAIHLAYWTADVDAAGIVRFYPDVYHFDGPDLAAWKAADSLRLQGFSANHAK